MCFGESYSWRTFIVGSIFIGLSLYYHAGDSLDNLVMCLIIGGIVIMQLWEALAWRGYCTFATWAAYISLLLQAVPLFLLVPRAIHKWQGKLALGLLLLYYATVFIGSGVPECMLSNGKQIQYTWHTKWWQQTGYIITLGIVPMLLFQNTTVAKVWALLFLGSLLVTNRIYGRLETNGSIWCYYGTACSVILYGYLALSGSYLK